jgi:hypothetical protein
MNTRKQIEVCTAEFFPQAQVSGRRTRVRLLFSVCRALDQRFVEQVLASHSQFDGSHELPEIPRIVRSMEGPRSEPAMEINRA